jgi:hypothetical protein
MKEIQGKINKISQQISEFSSKIKNKDKRYCLFHKEMTDALDNIETIISDYLMNNKSNIEVDEQIDKYIKNAEHTRNTINLFTPFILHYQILNDINSIN